MLEAPASGFGRPSVYAGGGPTGERKGPTPIFALDNPPSVVWKKSTDTGKNLLQVYMHIYVYLRTFVCIYVYIPIWYGMVCIKA